MITRTVQVIINIVLVEVRTRVELSMTNLAWKMIDLMERRRGGVTRVLG